MKIKVFDYIPELDCFVVREEFKVLMERLNLSEWTPVVWVCRLFILDNDYGEHLFDNWDEREQFGKKIKELGLKFDENELMIVVPERFAGKSPYCFNCNKRVEKAICPECKSELHVGADGPCHSDEQRKRFWTDVLDCLSLDLETIFVEARENNEHIKGCVLKEYAIENIEEIITEIRREYGN
jgi:hypothetical protein